MWILMMINSKEVICEISVLKGEELGNMKQFDDHDHDHALLQKA